MLGGLFGESMGLPLPGETVLLFSSFVSHRSNHLQLGWIVVFGIIGAVAGDNLGYFFGKLWGPSLLRWLSRTFSMKDDVATAREQIKRHGPSSVFWARFIIVFRTIAGPVAGVLGMDWRKFLLFNALGGACWVTAIALAGYAFATHFNTLFDYFEKVSWIVEACVFTAGYLLWRRQRKQVQKHAAS